MTTSKLEITVTVRKSFLFWPAMGIAKIAVMLGADAEKVASFVVDKFITLELSA